MSSAQTSTLREQFERARCEAVASTDEYNGLSGEDPQRAPAWERVMSQTEAARSLLEEWLRAEAEVLLADNRRE